jgi:hypothetical protein
MASIGEVLNAFARGESLRAMNMRGSIRKRGQRQLPPLDAGECVVLFSYDEPIAIRIASNVFVVAAKNPTRTTSRHINALKVALMEAGIDYKEATRAQLRAEAGLDPDALIEKLEFGQRVGSRAPEGAELNEPPAKKAPKKVTVTKAAAKKPPAALVPAARQANPLKLALPNHEQQQELRAEDFDDFLEKLDDVGGVDTLVLHNKSGVVVGASTAYAPSNTGVTVVLDDVLLFGPDALPEHHLKVLSTVDQLGFKVTTQTHATVEYSDADVLVLSANGDIEPYKEQ